MPDVSVEKRALCWYLGLAGCQFLYLVASLTFAILAITQHPAILYFVGQITISAVLLLLMFTSICISVAKENIRKCTLYFHVYVSLLMLPVGTLGLIVVLLCRTGCRPTTEGGIYNYDSITGTTGMIVSSLLAIISGALGLIISKKYSKVFGIRSCRLRRESENETLNDNIQVNQRRNFRYQQHHNNVSTVSSGHHVSTVSSGHQGITTSGFEPPPYSPSAIELRIPGVDSRLPLRQPSSIQTASSHVSDDPPKYSDIVFPSEPPPPYEGVNNLDYRIS